MTKFRGYQPGALGNVIAITFNLENSDRTHSFNVGNMLKLKLENPLPECTNMILRA